MFIDFHLISNYTHTELQWIKDYQGLTRMQGITDDLKSMFDALADAQIWDIEVFRHGVYNLCGLSIEAAIEDGRFKFKDWIAMKNLMWECMYCMFNYWHF